MQSKFGLVALSVMATLVLFGGDTAKAKSNETDKKEEKKVVATIKAGDTLTDIATKYKTSYIRLFNANESITNPDLIFVGDKVRVPGKDEKLPNRLAELAPAEQTQVIAGAVYSQAGQADAPVGGGMARGSSAGNTYAQGWCTWYAKEMRPDLPNNLGNGGQWVANAAAQGIPTGSSPRTGAIAEEPGHVAYVESVNGDGTITISEMGWNYQVGQFNRRTVPASNYRYIY